MVAVSDSYFKNVRVVVTGGTGFIGSHLVAKILEHQPKAIRLVSSGSSTERVAKHLPSLELKTFKSAEQYTKLILEFKPDYLFILGGNSDPRLSISNPRLDLEYNLLYNFELLEAIHKSSLRPKIIYTSSVAVYGDCFEALEEQRSITVPKSPYGINKLATEGYIRFYAQTFGLEGFSVRLSATYGPGLKKQVVYDFIQKLLKDPQNLSVMGDGSEIRDLTYVDDQVDGLLLLAERANYTGEVYNLGSGVGISVAELGKKIGQLMELNPQIILEKGRHEKHYAQNWVLDIKQVRQLGHLPKTPIDEGLRKTIAWAKSQ